MKISEKNHNIHHYSALLNENQGVVNLYTYI